MELIAAEKAEEKIRLNSRKAAIARHADEKVVKDDFLAFLREDEIRLDNIAEAARSYCKTSRFAAINLNKRTGKKALDEVAAPVTLQNYAYQEGLTRRAKRRRQNRGVEIR